MKPTEKQLNYIAKLLGRSDNKFHSDAYAAIERTTGTSERKATSQDASRTIDALKKYSNPPMRKVSKTSGWIKASAVRFVKKAGQSMQVLIRRAPRRKRKK